MICVFITNEYDKALVHVHGERLNMVLSKALLLKYLSDSLMSPAPHSVNTLNVYNPSHKTGGQDDA